MSHYQYPSRLYLLSARQRMNNDSDESNERRRVRDHVLSLLTELEACYVCLRHWLRSQDKEAKFERHLLASFIVCW